MNVAQCLVKVQKTVAAKRGRPSMSPEPQSASSRPVQRPVQDVRPLPEVQFDMVDHMPNYDEKKEATRCKMPYCTGKTHVFCDKCNIHLCFVPQWNCFRAAHRKMRIHENIHKLMSSQVQVPFQGNVLSVHLPTVKSSSMRIYWRKDCFFSRQSYLIYSNLLSTCACSDFVISLSACRLPLMTSLLFSTHTETTIKFKCFFLPSFIVVHLYDEWNKKINKTKLSSCACSELYTAPTHANIQFKMFRSYLLD